MRPQRLYKYYGLRRWADMFQDWTIRFSPLDEFNDPFEGLPAANRIWGPEFMKMFRDERLPNATAEQLNAVVTTDDKKKLLDEIRKILRRTSIFCLTTSFNNLLMWSHYADSHRGFVVEFKMDSSFFTQEYSDTLWQAKPVKYVQKRPVIDGFSEFLTTESKFLKLNDAFFYTKGRIWDYEKEYRMLCSVVLPNFKCRTIKKGQKEITGIHDIPPDAVSGVIFGASMDAETIEECCKDLSRPDCAHIKLQKAQLHPTGYALEIKDL